MATQPQRIAILGGGVGAMTAAFWLSSGDNWQDRYQIDVYQMGWRLGGKGASGRNPDIAHAYRGTRPAHLVRVLRQRVPSHATGIHRIGSACG